MLIIGVTGSIGMGKTTAANDFLRFGVPVHGADKAVHELMGIGGAAVGAVAAEFPDVWEGGAINRVKLARAVFRDPERLRCLEKILHPRVAAHRDQFLMKASRRRARMVALDVPLLFETGGNANCDIVVTVSAPAFIQRYRVLKRPGMDIRRFDEILAQQMSDAEKRQRSDFIVPTGMGRLESLRKIRKIIVKISDRPSHNWPPWAAGRRGIW